MVVAHTSLVQFSLDCIFDRFVNEETLVTSFEKMNVENKGHNFNAVHNERDLSISTREERALMKLLINAYLNRVWEN